MEYISPFEIEIPISDLNSYIFSSGDEKSRQSPQYFDAETPSRCYSLAEAEILVKRTAKGLQHLGGEPGDKILLFSGNSLHFPVLFWGVVAAECVFTGCTPSASVQELVYQLQDSGAKFIFAGPDVASKAIEAAKIVGIPTSRVLSFCEIYEEANRPQPGGLQPWTSIWADEEDGKSWSWRKIATKEEAQNTTIVINYSSGTTGHPKGVEISHYNLIANAEQVNHKRNLVANTPKGRARKARLQVSGDRWLAAVPMYHAYGQSYFCTNGARSGAKIFVMKAFNLDKYILYHDIYRITFMNAVPTMLVMLSKSAAALNYNFRSIEQVVVGSAPLSKDIAGLVQKRLLKPGVKVKQGWGMTELTCTGTSFAPDDEDDGASIGPLNANMSAKIMPIKDRDFGNATKGGGRVIGEIWVSGPNMMKGYYNKPKETAETIVVENGKRWLKTGDIGYFDERECLYIVDRLKELIKVKGLQVAPAELESILLLHPQVQDAAVAAVKKDGNEFPKGYVVRKSPTVTAQDLQKWVEGRASKHKWLTGGISFIETVPRTASGKVKRRELKNAKLEINQSKL